LAVAACEFAVDSRGDGQILDITERVAGAITGSGIVSGVVTVFIPGATAAVTTIEFEEGACRDFNCYWERVIPQEIEYAHHLRWGDGNGHSHVRAAALGPSLAVPFTGGRLLLGTWQQIVVVDFDNQPRKRMIVCQVMGENQ